MTTPAPVTSVPPGVYPGPVQQPPSATAHYYVEPTAGNDANNGLSWGDAFATIGAAVTALGGNAGTVHLAAGTHTVTSALPNTNGVKYVGAGRKATTISVTSGSLFTPAAALQYLRFESLKITTSGSHIFALAGGGGLIHSVFNDCALNSAANAAGIVSLLSGSGSFQENAFIDCEMTRNGTATVPLVKVVDSVGGCNGNRFERLTAYGNNNTSAPAFYLEAAGAGDFAYDNAFIDIVGEQNCGGLVHLYSCRNPRIENVFDYDATTNYVNDIVKLTISATNTIGCYDAIVLGAGRRGGTLNAGVYDVNATPNYPNTFNVVIFCGGNSTNTPAINGGDFVFGLANRVVKLSAGCTFTTGQNTTANRPSAATQGEGAMFYDTSLTKPIWSDGANWRDASGTIV